MSHPEEKRGMYLVKRGRWNLSRSLTGRLGLCLLLLGINLAIFLVIFIWFRSILPYTLLGTAPLVVGTLLWLYGSPIDPTAKLSWMALLAIAPVSGSMFLLYSRSNLGHRKLIRSALRSREAARAALGTDEAALEALTALDPGAGSLGRYMTGVAGARIFSGCRTVYFPLGEDFLPALLRELEAAERSIWMEYFILSEGEMWGAILEVLARKAAQGLDVRVMYDGTCEFTLLPRDYPARLKKLGIACRVFCPATPVVSTHYNYRDHRKITVIDGKTAFTGGVNLADEYINVRSRYGHWKDNALLVRGPAAAGFASLFLENWALGDKEPEAALEPAPPEAGSSGFVIPYGDGPVDGQKVGRQVYIDLLARARTHVRIATPYLVPDSDLDSALCFAAQRGVWVTLLLPGIPDSKFTHALAMTYCAPLLRAGVEIHTYTPGFLHAKMMTVDGREAVVGTINMDFRSLYHNFECAAWLVGTDSIRDMEADLDSILEQSTPMTPARLKARPWHQKLLGALMRVVAPLL